MIVHVRRKHIRSGTRGECFTCPIALAISDATRKTTFVGRHFVWINPSTDQTRIPLPPEAIAFIRDFDQGRPVQPFSFELEWEG